MKTILIIDDDDLCRTTAAELLRAHDWQVMEACNGEEGVAMALEHLPDVVLSDLLMARGNGFSVCRILRSVRSLRATKLLVMSGRDYPVDRENAADAGADSYLVKPVAFQALAQALALPLGNGSTGGKASRGPLSPAPGPEDSADGSTVIRFWGVRGSIPTPGPETVFYGGNTSCVEVRAEGEIIVLDAGTGIRQLGIALAEEFKGQPMRATLLISHTHWDHIQGFPFFRPAYEAKNQLRILGYEGAAASLAGTLAGQMESPYFPIPLEKLPGNILIEELREMQFHLGPVRITTCFSKHPGVCVGFRLHTSAGSIVYLPDNEWADAESAAAQEAEPCTQENVLVEFIRGAQIVIIDAQYDRDEYHAHKGWGHGCVDDVVRLALLADVEQLYLFHHDPEHDDTFVSRMVEHAQQMVHSAGSTMRVEAAREGAEVRLQSTVRVS